MRERERGGCVGMGSKVWDETLEGGIYIRSPTNSARTNNAQLFPQIPAKSFAPGRNPLLPATEWGGDKPRSCHPRSGYLAALLGRSRPP